MDERKRVSTVGLTVGHKIEQVEEFCAPAAIGLAQHFSCIQMTHTESKGEIPQKCKRANWEQSEDLPLRITK